MRSHIEALLIEGNHSDAQLVETVAGLSSLEQPLRFCHVERFDTAVSLLRTTPFDIVLLDLHLPDGKGTSLIRRLKAIAPDVPLVVITDLSDEEMEAMAFSEGADDYLDKSSAFSPQKIAEIGFVDVGNLLVERLHKVIKQARLSAAFEATDTHPQLSVLLPQASEVPNNSAKVSISQTEALSPSEHFVQSTLYSVGITLMSTLGIMHLEEGRYDRAECLLTSALKIHQQLLGPTHPDVIVSLHNLATLYDNQGRYIEAECLYYEALALCEEIFGMNSAVTRKFRNYALVISRLNQSLERLA